ncbi:ribokinase [Dyadobacter frigoris]|uniref:Ribokinase n=1 Tax=Dyadobacter frigoris TaxID=2576211 RepID=A0A4U6CQU0_9BACT|nr:ribokinase [Dyadobacter frigoris]TKT86902.1 ribokinase [Dyadobacter frigoris]GLU56596.1 ribokinase [Dyadobacter frigoris]
MSARILVIGSSNTDMVIKTKEFPQPGQTVLGQTFLMNPGGKGANQAVAAARLGAEVSFVAKVGKDIFGNEALDGFKREGLNTDYILQTADFPSGVASIIVNENGENQIVVASGANMDLKSSDLTDRIFDNIDLVLLQLEIPLATIQYIVSKCNDLKIKVILNPAPAVKLDDDLLSGIYLITPNETETQLLTGILPDSPESMREAALFFRNKGIENVIITLGKNGVYLFNDQYSEIIPAVTVVPVDTTAAGDIFNGAVVTALAEGKNWIDACKFACKASAISVTRMGAQSSAPYQHELN